MWCSGPGYGGTPYLAEEYSGAPQVSLLASVPNDFRGQFYEGEFASQEDADKLCPEALRENILYMLVPPLA
jgi:hypothetical protein